ncbi:MAG: SoxR reducing system RseC family protein [Candidatus Endonucleobacter sp. (ex Gigantidas childressi)]|nr:SoxR reducing system RseC family protein [Candidatus Endonucleobacter sp. (ex Gigantidas childressi)]
MMEELGVVVMVDGRSVCLEIQKKTTCLECQVSSSCGRSLADKYLSQHHSRNHHKYIHAESDLQLVKGDRVNVGIHDGALLKVCALVYLLPLVFIMSAIGLSSFFQFNDAVSVFASATGLLISLLILRLFDRKVASMCDVRVAGLVSASLEAPMISLVTPKVMQK